MTVKEFNSLADGTFVWFSPPYFAFPMPATVRIRDGQRRLWINFYGDAQCRFEQQDGREKRFADWVTSDGTSAKKLSQLNWRGVPVVVFRRQFFHHHLLFHVVTFCFYPLFISPTPSVRKPGIESFKPGLF
ncbi:MAG: hypothetical protein MJ202_01610 [Lentisphaeria bacterium]|nr:hypothetical protein [Lentisphaeria bacterium]